MGCCDKKEIILTDQAPKAIGPYSVGVRAGHFLYTAGQIALDPATNTVVEGGIEAETHQVFKNLKAILEAGGSCLENVVKTTVFLRDMADFAAMNGVYAQYLGTNSPVRTTVAVSGLPKGVMVEIEVVALLCDDDGECCKK